MTPNPPAPAADSAAPAGPKTFTQRFLDRIEWAGNKLPDPAVLFLVALLATWVLSALLSGVTFTETDPRTVVRDAAGQVTSSKPIQVRNLLSGEALAQFLSRMVKTYSDFPPLGVVLVAMLGVGIAEHTGFIQAVIKQILSVTPRMLLTPVLLVVAIISHSAGDTGYVLVIPLGGIIFAAAGRHPVAGIVAAFAGVSGGFSASFLPSSLDPLLQGFTQSAAQVIAPGRLVNPLCNWFFMSASCVVIVGLGWFLTDVVIERRLRGMPLDGGGGQDQANPAGFNQLTGAERRGLWLAYAALGTGALALTGWAMAPTSALRSPQGSLTAHGAPLMEAIVPVICILSLIPGVIYGYAAGTVKTHRDVVAGMSKSMSSLGYYLVMAFGAAMFTAAFRDSNLGALLAIKGARLLETLALPSQATIVGIILVTTSVNLLIGSASAKWALLGPIFVPMLMQVGISPELTQAAYRIGDSSTNIITPLMPYFPLIVVYAQRYVRQTGIGTLAALMLPYSITFLVAWTALLLVYWGLGLPLGLQATYTHP